MEAASEKEGKSINQDITLEQNQSFEEAGLDTFLQKCYQRLNYHKPTPIQFYALKTYEEQKNDSIIAHSKSGTGKTLSYLSLLLTNILKSNSQITKRCSYLIMLPTRQLSLQVFQTFKEILATIPTIKPQNEKQKQNKAKLKEVRLQMCIGGIPFEDDKRNYNVNGGTVIVGTMGRVMEFVQKKLIKIPELKMLVLDEGDKLFEGKNKKFMTFLDNILKYSGNGTQKIHFLIYSATFNNKILSQLSKKRKCCFIQTLADKQNRLTLKSTSDINSINELDKISNQKEETANTNINLLNIKKYKMCLESQQQSLFNSKIAALNTLLHQLSYQRCLVFVQKKTLLEQINQRIIEAGLDPLLIHGSLSQSSRIKLMNQINHSSIILASDLLARGIDIELDLVILFDAKRGDTFWHRIGRTGRFGKLGVAISLDDIEDWEIFQKEQVQNQLNEIKDSFNKQKQWFGTYMTEVGQWNQINEEKEIQMEQEFKYFDESKFKKGRKCYKKDNTTTKVQQKQQNKMVLEQIKSQSDLNLLIVSLLACPRCQTLMNNIQNTTGHEFKIKTYLDLQNVNH